MTRKYHFSKFFLSPAGPVATGPWPMIDGPWLYNTPFVLGR
jgi:hypothetical protein